MKKYNDVTSTIGEEEYILRNQYDCLTITVSSLDLANDYIQFYCYQNEKEIILTDDGYYLNNFSFKDKLPQRIKDKIKYYGLELKRNNELILKDKAKNFVTSKKIFVKAILSILEELK